MRILPTEKYNKTFGITTKFPKKNIYAPNCWNEMSEGSFKNYNFKVFKNYINGTYGSTLIVLKNGEKWIKSKLKYFEDGKLKALWSYAKEKKK